MGLEKRRDVNAVEGSKHLTHSVLSQQKHPIAASAIFTVN
jgi:hypothetical protein